MRSIVAKHNVTDHDEHHETEPAVIALAGKTYPLDNHNLYEGEDRGKYKWDSDDFLLIP